MARTRTYKNRRPGQRPQGLPQAEYCMRARKPSYVSERVAKTAMGLINSRIQRRRGGGAAPGKILRAYSCGHCAGWHLTSQPPRGARA